MNTISVRFLAAALMAVVFVCGFLSGRLTAPREGVVDLGPVEDAGTEEEVGKSVDRRVMRRYVEDLGLTRDQVRVLRPMFAATGARMLQMPKNSEERLEELERFHVKMDPHLTEEQRVKARAILDRAVKMKRETETSPEK